MRDWASGSKSPTSWAFLRFICMLPTAKRGPRKTRRNSSRDWTNWESRSPSCSEGSRAKATRIFPTVVRTVGLVPPETRAARTQEMKEISDFARLLGCDVVALHLGFIPHDTSDPLYRDVLAVTRDVCDHAKANGQNLHLETGQETADGLLRFIGDVQRDNLFVNFDPANMILYGTGEPIAALQQIGSRVRSVHCKDGKWAANPGQEWGQEVPLGEGDVGMENYLRTLDSHRLHRTAHHRTGNPAGTGTSEGGNRPGHPAAERTEGQEADGSCTLSGLRRLSHGLQLHVRLAGLAGMRSSPRPSPDTRQRRPGRPASSASARPTSRS